MTALVSFVKGDMIIYLTYFISFILSSYISLVVFGLIEFIIYAATTELTSWNKKKTAGLI